jgi:hypothetical protein
VPRTRRSSEIRGAQSASGAKANEGNAISVYGVLRRQGFPPLPPVICDLRRPSVSQHRPITGVILRAGAIVGLSLATTLAGLAAILIVWTLLWPLPAADFLAGAHMPDPEIGWVLRPRSDGPEVFTDDRGARVSGPTHHPVHVDLLSIGDSQTFGAGVPADDTFTVVTGRLAGITAVNYGVSGYSGVQALLMLRRHLDDRPRFVVYGFWYDHLNRNLIPCLENGTIFCVARPVVGLESGRARIEGPRGPVHWGLPAAWRWTSRLLVPLALVRGTVQRVELSDGEKQRAAAFVLSEMAATAMSAQARLVVVWIPQHDKDVRPAPSWLAHLAVSAHCALIDAGPAFARLRARGQPIDLAAGPYAGHLTASAHRAIAALLAAEIDPAASHRGSWPP